MTTCRQRRVLHRGFTLMELLLVLAVLAVVLSLALPELHRLSRKSEIRDAAKQLRLALLQTRLAAIEAGSAMCFRYRPDSSAFEVLAAGAATGEGTATSAPAETGAALRDVPTSRRPARGDRGPPAAQTLPAGVRFVGASPGAVAPRAESPAPATASASGDWSEPIVFFPNGRTGNAQFRLSNDRYWLDVTLRGLTGRVQIGSVQRWATATEEPLPNGSSESLP